MLHVGTLGKGPTDLATLEVFGPDEEGRIGIGVGPHKGQRHIIWLNRGAVGDVIAELQQRHSMPPLAFRASPVPVKPPEAKHP